MPGGERAELERAELIRLPSRRGPWRTAAGGPAGRRRASASRPRAEVGRGSIPRRPVGHHRKAAEDVRRRVDLARAEGTAARPGPSGRRLARPAERSSRPDTSHIVSVVAASVAPSPRSRPTRLGQRQASQRCWRATTSWSRPPPASPGPTARRRGGTGRRAGVVGDIGIRAVRAHAVERFIGRQDRLRESLLRSRTSARSAWASEAPPEFAEALIGPCGRARSLIAS